LSFQLSAFGFQLWAFGYGHSAKTYLSLQKNYQFLPIAPTHNLNLLLHKCLMPNYLPFKVLNNSYLGGGMAILFLELLDITK